MNKRRMTLVVTCIVALAIGFGVARATGEPAVNAPRDMAAAQALAEWLDLDAQQTTAIAEHDPAFADDLVEMRQALAARRQELAAAMERPDATAQEIRERLEAAIEADHVLERRVVEYLLAVREHLSADQQKRLFSLAADGIRRGGGYCRSLLGPGTGQGMGQGMGQGQGQGRGMGMGGQRRRGQ